MVSGPWALSSVMTSEQATVLSDSHARIGWLVNPFAGVGGAAANKGSDDAAIQARARGGELALRAPVRAAQFLTHLRLGIDPRFVTVAGDMGANSLLAANIPHDCVSWLAPAVTTGEDTRSAALALLDAGVDLLVFVGGDGTARDLCASIGCKVPVLGVPSGVKMHSGVFAITPEAAAEVLQGLVTGQLTALIAQEVRDIDETAFRAGNVRSRHFGEMLVPAENHYMQHVKQGGMEVEELVLMDIAAEIRERIDGDTGGLLCLIFAPGSTTQFIQQELGFDGTLLGVDVIIVDEQHRVVSQHLDVDAPALQALVSDYPRVKLIVTAIGGQGHILGRGNQQLSPSVLARIGKDNVWVVATKSKLEKLDGRPLLMDSADAELDRLWTGFIPVICGYRDVLLYRLGHPVAAALVGVLVAEVTRNLNSLAGDSRRLFHGRGGCFPGLEWCTVDYFAPVFFITLFNAPPAGFLEQVEAAFRSLVVEERYPGWEEAALLVQHRYQKPVGYSTLFGCLPAHWQAKWQRLAFVLEANHQNVGFFLDAEPVRHWLQRMSRGKRVLNLFAYTCALSVVASAAGANYVLNIDMSRKSLDTGRRNHRLNGVTTDNVQFLAHNILNSWGKLKKLGPYDIVVADPPSFQKGSFVLTKDYPKVLRRMVDLVVNEGYFVACANAPELTANDFRAMIEEACPQFTFVAQLPACANFPDADPQRALKVFVYQR